MRRAIVLSIALFVVLSFAVKILNPIGPSIIPVVGILEGEIRSNVEVSFWKNVDEVVAHVKKKDVDIVVIPVSMGANLYNRGIDIKLSAVTMWKAFYLVGKEKINGVWDLVGEKVYMPHTKGTTVDVVLRYMLKRLGFDPDKDVKLVYAPPQEIVALMKANRVKFAALPEPFVTIASKIPGFEIVLDFQKEWALFTGLEPRIPITGVFILKDTPEVKKALEDLRKSLGWALKNSEKACELATRYLKKFKKAILLEAFKRSDYDFRYASSDYVKRSVMEYLEVINETYPKAMPKVPDEGFFQSR